MVSALLVASDNQYTLQVILVYYMRSLYVKLLAIYCRTKVCTDSVTCA